MHRKYENTKPDINFCDAGGRTTLDWYSDYNAKKVVETLIEKGADVNSRCEQDDSLS
ncbi:ankyrin repeat domain-containing protein [Rickettsia tamurae]|uniref:ankyrin repeat domain-containing protein n=1 Tax=Rickettsia tamurae TaxID=334545 RepID=UPI00050A0D4A|nr:ankyrin repeat domain-containing protein [Rickettsia tamurae]